MACPVRGARGGPEGDGAARVAVPEPAPRAGHRSGVPGRRVLRRPRRGAGQVRDGARRHAWTARRSPPRRRRSGTPGRRTTRPLLPWPPPGCTGLVPARPGPRGGHKLTGQVLAWAEEQLAADPQLKAAALAGPIAGGIRGARAPPLRGAGAGPPPGAPQKPLTHPPATAGRRTARPCPRDLHLAARLLNRASPPGCRPGSCSRRRAGRPLRAAASCCPARTRDRVPARARRAHRQGRHRLAARPGPPGPRGRPDTPRTAGGAAPPPARPGRRPRCRAQWPPSSSMPWPPSPSRWPEPDLRP